MTCLSYVLAASGPYPMVIQPNRLDCVSIGRSPDIHTSGQRRSSIVMVACAFFAPRSCHGQLAMTLLKRRYAPEARLLLLAVTFLALGVLVYVFDRSVPALFLPAWLHAPAQGSLPGFLGGSLPVLVHTLAMILVTAAILWPWPRSLPFNCLAWLAIECAFELGQATPVDGRIAAALPEWFASVPVADTVGDYFLSGTFDYMDVGAIGIGAFIAYLVVRIINLGREP